MFLNWFTTLGNLPQTSARSGTSNVPIPVDPAQVTASQWKGTKVFKWKWPYQTGKPWIRWILGYPKGLPGFLHVLQVDFETFSAIETFSAWNRPHFVSFSISESSYCIPGSKEISIRRFSGLHGVRPCWMALKINGLETVSCDVVCQNFDGETNLLFQKWTMWKAQSKLILQELTIRQGSWQSFSPRHCSV